MFNGSNQGPDSKLFLRIIFVLSCSTSAILSGCSAWISSPQSGDPAVTHFGYTKSSLAETIVPPNPSTPISDSYFGMTIHRLVPDQVSSLPTAPFPAFPVHTFRLWDVANWMMLEPANGEYDWGRMDDTIAIAQRNGVKDFVFTFGAVPAWASDPANSCTGEPGPCAPDTMAFDDFSTHVVRRYCGVVQYYETWNEPNLEDFWKGTNAQLVNLASHLNQIAKDPANCGCSNGVCSPGGGANPNQVLLPSINSINQPSLAWLNNYLATAGPSYPYADVATFHGYGYTQPEDIGKGLAQLKSTLAKQGLSQLELWDTEASWGTAQSSGQEDEASWLIRFHVVQRISGVSRFVWYAYDNCAWGTLWGSLCGKSPDNWQGVRLPGEAYATVEDWMVGATVTHCDRYDDGLWACELQRPGGYEAWILWASAGTSLSVPISAKFQLKKYRDWRNNTSDLPAEIAVDEMPLILEN